MWCFSKKVMIVLMIMALTAVVLSGCGGSTGNNSAETTQAQTKVVVDFKGNEVEMSDNITRVAVSGALNQMVLILGQPEKIVATAEGVQKSFFATVFPGILNVPAAYTGAGPGTLNMETLVAAKPQVMFGASDEQKTVLANANIVSLEMGLVTPEEIKKTLSIMAQVLGDGAEEKAKAFNEYYDKNLNYVSDTTKSAEMVRVFVAGSDGASGGISTIGLKDIHTSYIEAAGGENIVAKDAAFSGEASPSVDFEYLLKVQPDVIIASSTAAYDAIVTNSSDNMWQELSAVKNGKVYLVPKGVYLWNVRSCEGALQPLFLASVLHPDLFSELDLKKETKDFYSQFYNYSLTDEEVDLMFKQKL
ncbi:ABC transporter substrate-binding protein [Lachnospiraceae bacterium ZAX-1]